MGAFLAHTKLRWPVFGHRSRALAIYLRLMAGARLKVLQASLQTTTIEGSKAMDEFSLSQREASGGVLRDAGWWVAVVVPCWLRLSRVGIGLLGVSFAFGLSVLTVAYAVGHVSGGHFNPAVTVGLCRTPVSRPGRSSIHIAACRSYCWRRNSLRARQWQSRIRCKCRLRGEWLRRLFPGGYSLTAALVAELVMTFFFLIVILGATNKRAPQAMAGVAIGLALTLIHLVTIPGDKHLCKSARSTGPAICGRLGHQAMALLASADHRRSAHRCCLSFSGEGTERRKASGGQ